ncbi:MAG: nucleotide exchange factor GrpE, partial [Acidimicrobiales bacterium]
TGDEQSPPVEETFAASAEDEPGDTEEGATLDEMIEEDFAKLAAERDEYLDSLRRLQADFDNYRKRAGRQQNEMLERASENLLVELLPVLDALDLAEAHGTGESNDASGALSQIGMLLRGTLTRQGLERIDAVGVDFDPTVHDAVAHEEAADEDGQEEGRTQAPQVAEVMRAGYRLKGRVVRPAMVRVHG